MINAQVARVAIVVLNWNGSTDTLRCLDAVARQIDVNPVIIVVDNNSEDESLHRLRPLAASGRIVLLENDSNDGFAGGVNVGITYALARGFDAVALLNNDAVPQPRWLVELVTAMNESKAAIVTGLLLDEAGSKVDSAGDFYSWWGMPFPRARGEDADQAPASGFVASASGGATLYRSDVFREIGLFDENFFAYFEDVDLSLRAQSALLRVYYTRDAVAFHARGSSSSQVSGLTTYQSFKNLPLLAIKNVPGRYLPLLWARFSLLYGALLVNAIRTGRGKPALRGMRSAITLTFTYALTERRRIQRLRQLSAQGFTRLMSPHDPWQRQPPSSRRP